MTSSHFNTDIEAFYKKSYTIFFDVAIIAFGVYYAFQRSQLDAILITRPIKHFAYLLSVSFSILSLLHNYRWNKFRTFVFLFMVILPFFAGLLHGIKAIGIPMLILGAYNIPFSHITKMCSKAIVVVLAIVLISLFLDVVEDRLYFRDVDGFKKNYAHDLGFQYYSFYAYLGMGWVQCMILYWMKRLNLTRILCLVLVSFLFFWMSSTRLQLYCCIMFLVSVFLLPIIPKWVFNNKLTLLIGITIYPLLCFLVYYVSKYSILALYLDNFSDINKITSGRLALNVEALQRYDVNLWGNNLEFDTDLNSKDYFYIDSGYLHTLLGHGLVYTSMIMCFYSLLFYKVYKAKAYFLYMWLFIFAFICIINGFLMSPLANPIILLFLTDTRVIAKDYQLFCRKTKTKFMRNVLKGRDSLKI